MRIKNYFIFNRTNLAIIKGGKGGKAPDNDAFMDPLQSVISAFKGLFFSEVGGEMNSQSLLGSDHKVSAIWGRTIFQKFTKIIDGPS